MRGYIFTPLERKLIQAFLKGDIPTSETNIRKLLYRVKTFKDLAADVESYLAVRRRLSKSEAAVST